MNEAQNTHADATVVKAVMNGDRERYRELVNRYERQSYALAWSRLGDAALAEEATQEAFIQAYQNLPLLLDANRFAAWLMAITRRLAINLGIHHRRELQKRQRWALQSASPQESTIESPSPEICPPEILQATLSELPPKQRECLVLFYLEGKSGTEAATLLGLSESAFRVRLHRAKAALRERLEMKLDESLGRLSPHHSLAPGIMAATSALPAVGSGGGLLSILGKLSAPWGSIIPFHWLLIFLPAFSLVPGIYLNRWLDRWEQRNLIDPKSFRASRWHCYNERTHLLGMIVLLFLSTLILLFSRLDLGKNTGLMVLMGIYIAIGLMLFRQWRVCPNRISLSNLVGIIVITLVMPFMMNGDLTLGMFFAIALLPISLSAWAYFGWSPRMDYSLFLRAVHGLLPSQETGVLPRLPIELSRQELRSFASFLGSHWLVIDRRWTADGIRLRLAPVDARTVWFMMFSFWRKSSEMAISWNQKVTASLGDRDLSRLRQSCPGQGSNRSALEDTVSQAVASALASYRSGNAPMAERMLGHKLDEEIFHATRKRHPLRHLRSNIRLFHLAGIFVIVLMLLYFEMRPFQASLQPVQLTPQQVTQSLALLNSPADTYQDFKQEFAKLLREGLVLPTNTPVRFSAIAQAVRIVEFGHRIPELNLAFHPWIHLLLQGWVSLEDLNLSREQIRQKMEDPRIYQALFELHESGLSENYRFAKSEWLLLPLQLARHLNSLDLIDPSPIVQSLATNQVINARRIPGRRPPRQWKHVEGLFLTTGINPLQDTYECLAALDILGGLPRIDQKACVQGILRLHQGKGRFSLPRAERSMKIDGSAKDAFYAFESLRLLRALHRIDDLDRWEFRVPTAPKPGNFINYFIYYMSGSKSPSPAAPASHPASRPISWRQIEAWTIQQRVRSRFD